MEKGRINEVKKVRERKKEKAIRRTQRKRCCTFFFLSLPR